ncbi:hypothetical protein [Promicromonospora panici]|uniref:hypothetical protein n=1 Tax=Promicromonospora panici TaxID=2219658 RepID=UPI00101B84E6|nr:hypothetical protein [Promicromonospora panici]
MRTRRPLRLAGVVLAAAALLLGPAGVAHADEAEDTGISVTIPDVDPTDEPTDEPTPDPTDDPAPNPPGNGPGDGPSGNGDDPAGGGSGGGTGGGGTGGTDDPGTGGGTGNDTPGGGTDPEDDAPGDSADVPDPEECAPLEPAVPQEPADDGDAAKLDETVRPAGEEVVVRATDFGEREKVQLVLFAEPQVVETVRADGEGVVEAPVTIPEKTPSGPHALQLTGWCGQVAVAEILVASPGDGAAGAGIPAWAWWTGGGVGLAGVGVGGWYVFRLMRAPGAGMPVAGNAGVTV